MKTPGVKLKRKPLSLQKCNLLPAILMSNVPAGSRHSKNRSARNSSKRIRRGIGVPNMEVVVILCIACIGKQGRWMWASELREEEEVWRKDLTMIRFLDAIAGITIVKGSWLLGKLGVIQHAVHGGYAIESNDLNDKQALHFCN